MKYILLLLIFIMSLNFSIAQISTVPKSPVDSTIKYFNQPVFDLVEKMPVWKGCEKLSAEAERAQCTANKIQEFLARNMRYPTYAKDHHISGTTYVTFFIDTTGNVVEPKVMRGIHDSVDKEALRVVNLMPAWIPGQIKEGEKVVVQYTIPIKLSLK